jgi:hypothetical protein
VGHRSYFRNVSQGGRKQRSNYTYRGSSKIGEISIDGVEGMKRGGEKRVID